MKHWYTIPLPRSIDTRDPDNAERQARMQTVGEGAGGKLPILRTPNGLYLCGESAELVSGLEGGGYLGWRGVLRVEVEGRVSFIEFYTCDIFFISQLNELHNWWDNIREFNIREFLSPSPTARRPDRDGEQHWLRRIYSIQLVYWRGFKSMWVALVD